MNVDCGYIGRLSNFGQKVQNIAGTLEAVETDFSLLFIQLFLNSCIRVGMDIVLNLRNHMCSVIYQNEHFLREE